MRNWLRSNDTRVWLAIVGTSTLAIGAAYAIAQQSTRLSADDLPLQTAQAIKHQLANNASVTDAVPSTKTDLKSDSTVFAIITDANQNVLASSANLDGKTPLPPSGVFAYTKTHDTDRFTWQPEGQVRMATRVIEFSSGNGGGFIITGQSLKPAEDRIKTYGELALAAWLATLAWTTLVLYFLKPGAS